MCELSRTPPIAFIGYARPFFVHCLSTFESLRGLSLVFSDESKIEIV